MQYDEATNEEERAAQMQNIKGYYMSYMNYDQVKPDDLQRRAGADSESSEQEDGGAGMFYAGEKKVHEFDSEKHFTKA